MVNTLIPRRLSPRKVLPGPLLYLPWILAKEDLHGADSLGQRTPCMPLSNEAAVLSPASSWIDSPVLMHVLVVATRDMMTERHAGWSRLAVEAQD